MSIAARIDESCLIHPIQDTANTGNNLYVLRDDLLPFGLGGNKVRIALAFVEDMVRTGKNAMIAYGSATSNMCRVISNLCRAQGIPCTVVLSEMADVSTTCNNQQLMGIFGARVVTCTSAGIAAAVQSAMDYYEEQGLKPYYIFGNTLGQGNEHVAARAYAKAYQRVCQEAQNKGVHFHQVFCASGTQSTQSGLICGHLLAEDHAVIQGIMISSRATERAHGAIVEAAEGLLQEQGRQDLLPALEYNIHLIDTKRRGGYGVVDQDILDCINQQLCANGIPFDPVYTGKAFLGMQEYLVEEGITGQNILFVHTGGEPIFYDALSAGTLSPTNKA